MLVSAVTQSLSLVRARWWVIETHAHVSVWTCSWHILYLCPVCSEGHFCLQRCTGTQTCKCTHTNSGEKKLQPTTREWMPSSSTLQVKITDKGGCHGHYSSAVIILLIPQNTVPSCLFIVEIPFKGGIFLFIIFKIQVFLVKVILYIKTCRWPMMIFIGSNSERSCWVRENT